MSDFNPSKNNTPIKEAATSFVERSISEVNLLSARQAKLTLSGHGLSLLKPKFFTINEKVVEQESQSVDGIDSWDKKSLFGTPIFDIVTFPAFSYVDENGTSVNNSKLDLDVALIEVSKPRNIVRTVIAGKSGTVKEYMSDGDYVITIKGTFANPLAYSPPSQFIRDFVAITSAPIALKVESNFLNYFNIYTVVVDSEPSIKQREGTRNVVDYELHLLSDTPFEIKLQSGKIINPS